MTSPVKRSHVATCSRGEHVGKRYKWQILVTVVFGTFMAILDGTAVNVALPTLQHVFNTSVDQVDGVIIAYTLASGVTIPVTGFVAERFGSKRTYLTALALFVVGSACCALAPSLAWLVGFRVLQGVGGGMLAPLGIALLFDAFPEQERGLANGIFGLPLVVAPASGPLLGGYFTEYLNWRAIFLWSRVLVAALPATAPRVNSFADWMVTLPTCHCFGDYVTNRGTALQQDWGTLAASAWKYVVSHQCLGAGSSVLTDKLAFHSDTRCTPRCSDWPDSANNVHDRLSFPQSHATSSGQFPAQRDSHALSIRWCGSSWNHLGRSNHALSAASDA